MGSGRNDQDWRENRGQRPMHDEHRSSSTHGRGESGGERGFFERAGDEISSWFGDDEAERRREMDERSGGGGGWRDSSNHDRDAGRGESRRSGGDRDERGQSRDYPRESYPRHESRDFGRESERHGRWADDRDHRPTMGGRSPGEMAGSGRSPDMDREQNYRPMAGDYARSSMPSDSERSTFGAFGSASSRGTTAGGATTAHDRHYNEWRQRQIDELDRDYEEYRREHQSKFESEFSNWRSTRQSKRQMLGQIREHMQVVGSDDEAVGTIDKVRGDRVILTKSDGPDGQHHSLGCAMIDRVEGDRVILDRKAADARAMFGSEERDRALFERDDKREPGAHILNRSFSGTY
jgi:hypothetical protein